MLHPIVKTILVDEFLTTNEATHLATLINTLPYQRTEFGTEIPNFNVIDNNMNDAFSKVLNTGIEIIADQSGIFRKPNNLIHFESFDALNEWIFISALLPTSLNIFTHASGAQNALDGYKFNYRNLFEWNLTLNVILSPGQGALFRPWVFHSFSTGLVQIFKLKEYDNLLPNQI